MGTGEVLDLINGVYRSWQTYCQITDAPDDIKSTLIKANLFRVRLEGWITRIEQAVLNEQQLQTFASDILPHMKAQINTIINEAQLYREEASEGIGKQQLWWSSRKPILESRLANLAENLDEGDRILKQYGPTNGPSTRAGSFYDRTPSSSSSNPDDSSSAESRTRGDFGGSSSSQEPEDGSPHSAYTYTGSCGTGVESDMHSDTASEDSNEAGSSVKERFCPREFFGLFWDVFLEVDPWNIAHLPDNRYDAGTPENSVYKLISYLLVQSTRNQIPDYLALGVQHWLRAGAWNLALVSRTTGLSPIYQYI